MIARTIFALTLFASLFHHVDHAPHAEHVLDVLFRDVNRRTIARS